MASSTTWVRRHRAYHAVVRGWPERALLACSGGVDSSALLVLAGIAVAREDVKPFPVVYVDHRTRPDSAADGDAVTSIASDFGLKAVRSVVIPSDAVQATTSPEDQLRVQRYAALARAAGELDCDAVVTAHTRDDQVETVLMRILSGVGGAAMTGMDSMSVISTPAGELTIHRPLLDVSRAELVDVLSQAGVDPVHDPTNVHTVYRRNRLRHDVIPLLHEAFPGFDSALLRAGTLVSRDAAALDLIAAEEADSVMSIIESSVVVDRRRLRELHPAIGSRVVRLAVGPLMPANQRELTFERVESVRRAASGRTGTVIELPYDVVARVERERVVFERRNH